MAWKPFTEAEEKRIVTAVKEAENDTSGEIRVHVDRYCKTNPLLKAQNLFTHLKLNETELKNGVIIYVSIDDKQVAVYGDQGINEVVEPDFWDTTLRKMTDLFNQDAKRFDKFSITWGDFLVDFSKSGTSIQRSPPILSQEFQDAKSANEQGLEKCSKT